jgi:prophage regulatory protein
VQLVNQTRPLAPAVPDRLLPIKETCSRVGLSPSSVRNMERADLFPRSIPLTPSGSRVAWLESQVNAWIQERAQRAADASRVKSPNPRARAAQ